MAILAVERSDVREIEILGRSLGWTEERLECEATDHRHALLEGLGLSEESKTFKRVAVKPEEIGQVEDANMLGAERFGSLDRSAGQYAAKVTRTKMATTTQGSWKRMKKAARYLKRVET